MRSIKTLYKGHVAVIDFYIHLVARNNMMVEGTAVDSLLEPWQNIANLSKRLVLSKSMGQIQT
jgi:hypothetical protein